MIHLPGSRAWFDAYIAAFNARDYAGFSAYYAPQVDFRGQAATLAGRQAIIDFYGRIHQQVDETVEVQTFIGSPTLIAAELRTTLESKGDWPDFPTAPILLGERRHSQNFAFYEIADGLFTRIRTANFSRSAG